MLSSEEKRLAVNGMSYHDRAGENANSALIVTVNPEDFSHDIKGREEVHPLAGIHFQRELEEKAYEAGNGKIPVQLYGDFKDGKISEKFGKVHPAFCGEYQFADLRKILTNELSEAFIEGMESFGKKIKGFDRPDAIFSRCGKPYLLSCAYSKRRDIRKFCQGFISCGEGAGYAGGITSAAMDGLKVAEELIRRYKLTE